MNVGELLGKSSPTAETISPKPRTWLNGPQPNSKPSFEAHGWAERPKKSSFDEYVKLLKIDLAASQEYRRTMKAYYARIAQINREYSSLLPKTGG